MKIKRKSLIISIILLLVAGIAIGYAKLSGRLDINGDTGIGKNAWVIYFDNIVERDNNVEPTIDAWITDREKTNIEFAVDLEKPGDKYEFNVDIKNDGTIDACIDSLTLYGLDELNEKYLEFTFDYLDGTPVSLWDELLAKSYRRAKARVSFKKDIQEEDLPEEAGKTNLQLQIHYTEKGDNVCTPAKNEYTLYIDPGEGTYTPRDGETHNLVTGLYEKVLSPGDVFELGEITPPSKKIFTEWDPKNNAIYTTNYDKDTNSVIMDQNDAYVEAKYDRDPEGNYVARIVDKYYTSIQAALDDAESGDMIHLLKDTEESPINNTVTRDYIVLSLDGFKVTGMLTNNQKLRLVNNKAFHKDFDFEDPEVQKENYSAFINEDGYAMINNGTFALGYYTETGDCEECRELEKPVSERAKKYLVEEIDYKTQITAEDREKVLVEDIALIGRSTVGGIGLKQNSIFNFYDGYLEAYIGLSGVFNDKPDKYFVLVDHNNEKNCQKVYLITMPDRAIAKTIEENNSVRLYFNLQDAFNQSMEDDLVVYAIRNFESPYDVEVYEGKEATFDITGFEVETGYTFTNNGTFNITDSAPTRKGAFKPSVTMINNGQLNITNMKITGTTDYNVIENYGSMDIKESKITSLGGYAIDIATGDHIYMDDKTYIKSDAFAIRCRSNEEFTIKGGHIGGIHNTGNLTIEETTHLELLTFGDDTYGIKNDSEVAIVTLNNIDLDITNDGPNTYAIYNNNQKSRTVINGGNYILESTTTKVDYGFETKNGANFTYGGIVTVNDGIIKTINKKSEARVFLNANQVTINGGDITAEGKKAAIAVNSNIEILGGKVEAKTVDEANGESHIYYNWSPASYNVVIGGTSEVSANGTCIVIYQGTTTVNGGTITCKDYFLTGSNYSWDNWQGGISFNNYHFGTANINGGDITAGSHGIYGQGTLNMSGGTLTSELNGFEIFPYSSTRVNMPGGTIESLTGYALHSDSPNTTITIGGTEGKEPMLIGEQMAIYNEKAGLTFISGKALGKEQYGIYVAGPTIIGRQDHNVSITVPEIVGYINGVYIKDAVDVDMYDGVLKGQAHGYDGVITGTEDATQLYEEDTQMIDGNEYNLVYLIEEDAFVRVGDVTFNALQKAIDYIETEGTIVVLKDKAVRFGTNLPAGKTITIDFDGYNISMTKPLVNNGNLTLKTSVENEKAGFTSTVSAPLVNNNIMTINSGNYSTIQGMLIHNKQSLTVNGGYLLNNSTLSENLYGIYNDSTERGSNPRVNFNGGTLEVKGTGKNIYGIYSREQSKYEETKYNVTVTGGTIKTNSINPDRRDLKYNTGAMTIYGGSLIVTGGTIEAKNLEGNAQVLESIKSVRIDDGIFNSEGYVADIIDLSTAVVNGGTFTSNDRCAYMKNELSLTINGGTFTCGTDLVYGGEYDYNNYGFDTFIMTGGTATTGRYGVYGFGKITMTGGSITSEENTFHLFLDKFDSEVTMNGGTLISKKDKGIYSKSKKTNINIGLEAPGSYIEAATTGIYFNGGIMNINEADIIGRTEYGVYTNGTTTFGVDEGNISITQPMVRGFEYGVVIEEKTTTNINDGIFKGTKYGYKGFISGFPDATTITEDSELINGVNFVTNYLIAQDYFLRVDDEYFNSLQLAIDYITTSNTIYVIADHVVKTETVVPQEKDITIEFDGHTLLSSKTIINNGKLTLEDNGSNPNKSGGIASSPLNPITKLIDNKNELIINGGNYHGLKEIVINNEGTMEFNNGVIYNNAESEYAYGVYNKVVNKDNLTNFTMTGGTIEVIGTGSRYVYGVYNELLKIEASYNKPAEYYYVEGTYTGGEINVTSDLGITNTDNDGYNNEQYYNVLANELGAHGIYGGNNTISDLSITSTNEYGSTRGISFSPNTVMNSGSITSNGLVTGNVVATNFTMNHGELTSNGTNFSANIYDVNTDKQTYSIHNDSIVTSTQVCIDAENDIVNITGGLFTCGTDGVTSKPSEGTYNNRIGNYGTVNMSGGEIHADGYGTNGSGNYNMSNGHIYSKQTGMHLLTGTITMTGGSVESSEAYGMYSKSAENVIQIGAISTTPEDDQPYVYGIEDGIYLDNGLAILGYKDGNVDIDNFYIVGGPYGIYSPNLGLIKFYDGMLKGYTYGYLDGSITEIEAGTYIHEDSEVINELQYVVNYLIQDKPIVKNIDKLDGNGNPKEYSNLELAFTESSVGDHLVLIANAQLYYPVNIPDTVEVDFDLDGYNLVATRPITNNGTVVMHNTNSEPSKASTSLGINLFVNNGTLDITGIDLSNPTDRDTYLIQNNSQGIFKITDLNVNSVNNISNSGLLIADNCNFTSQNISIYDKGELDIDGGTITSENYGIFSESSKNGLVENIEISGGIAPVYKKSGSSTLTINNAEFYIGYIYNSSGTLNINDSHIYNYITNSAKLNITNTEIADYCYETRESGYDYTSMTNSGIMTFDHVTYTLDSKNNGHITMMMNTGTFNSTDSTYLVEKHHGTQFCWGYSPWVHCRTSFDGVGIDGTGNINTTRSTYEINDVSDTDLINNRNHLYVIRLSGNGRLNTDGDYITADYSQDAYGIKSTTTNQGNTMKDTTIHMKNQPLQYDIYLEDGKYITEGCTLTNEGAENAFGLYAKTGSFTFETGTVDMTAEDTVYGIYSDDFGADVTLGIKDGDGTENANVNTSNPYVKAVGGRVGIGVKKENGYFRFFDGLIIGNTAAKPDTTSETELYYEATNFYDDVTDFIFCRLEYMKQYATSLDDYIVVVNHTYYKTLNDAFRKALNGETVKLIKEVTQNGVNNNPASITLDLNGHSINGTITNNGTMTLIGGQINGLKEGLEYHEAVINNGTLYIGVNDNDIVYDEVVILSDDVALINTGDVIMYDGTIRGKTALEGRTIIPPYYAVVTKEIKDGYEHIYLERAEYAVGTTFEFEYSGREDVFVAPVDGYYELQTWGAQGGSYNDRYRGGYGAYSKGIVYLHAEDILYINVGGQGKVVSNGLEPGGYNGGGTADSHSTDIFAGSGGGATSITTTTGLLKEFYHKHENILIASSGGGGAYVSNENSSTGGSAGGITGTVSQGGLCERDTEPVLGTPASQTSGGSATHCNGYSSPYNGEFGMGMDGTYNQAGGGAGFFGGGLGNYHAANGGSSYIGNPKLISMNSISKVMYAYKGEESKVENTKTIATTLASEIATSGYAKMGNGYAKITIIGSDSEPETLQVVVNPDKVLYNGTNDQTIYFLKKGEQITLGEFANNDYFIYTGISISDETAIDRSTNTITMDEENIIVTATWTVDTNVVKASVDGDFYPTLREAVEAVEAVGSNTTVYLLADVTEDITIDSEYNITLDLGGNKLTGELINNTKLDLINGTVENPDGVAVTNNGTLNLGINDKNVERDQVVIIGKEAGIKQNGIFHYYDGTLEGETALDGLFDTIPTGYLLFADHNATNNRQIVYLMLIPDSQTPDNAIAKVSINGMPMFYYNLQDAIAYASKGGLTVEAIRDFDATYPLTVEEGKTVTLDLAGHTIATGTTITNNGNFTIKDSSIRTGALNVAMSITNNGTISFKNVIISTTTNANLIENYGDINAVNSSLTAQAEAYVINNYEEATITADNKSYFNSNYCIYNEAPKTSNGLIINGGNYKAIKNVGKLTINEGTAVNYTWSTNANGQGILNKGAAADLTINGATIVAESRGPSSNYAYGIYNENDGGYPTLKIYNVTIRAKAGAGHAQGITNGTVTMVNGTIEVTGNGSNTYGINAETVTVNGGSIELTSTNTNASAITGTTIKLNNNPTIESDQTCLKGNVEMNGGTLTCGNYGYYGSSNTFTMTGGSITATNDGLNMTSQYDTSITGGSITSENRGIYYNGRDGKTLTVNSTTSAENTHTEITGTYGIYAYNAGTLNVEDAIITGTENNGIYTNINTNIGINDSTMSNYPTITGETNAIEIANGTINIYDGNLKGNTNYGVYLKGNLNIGTNNNNVSTTIPTIEGNSYGLYISNGNVNFYDGILKGETNSYEGEIIGIVDGYEIKTGTEAIPDSTDELQTAYLNERDYFLQVGETKYNSLQKAIDAIDETGKILVLSDADIRAEATIPSGVGISLDLDGHTLTTYKKIINNGNLIIEDTNTTTTGGITYNVVNSIVNNNIMTVNNGNFNGKDTFIQNKNNLMWVGGNLTVSNGTNTTDIYALANEANATITIDSGNISIEQTGTQGLTSFIVHQVSTSRTVVNGGTLSSTANQGTSGHARGFFDGTVEFKGGTLSVNGNGGYTRGFDGTTIISGGTLSLTSTNNNATLLVGTTTIEANTDPDKNPTITSNKSCTDGTTTISAGTLTCGYYGVKGSRITMSGGSITAENNALYLTSGGTSNITGGSITSNNGNAIYYNGGSLTINSNDMPNDEIITIEGANGIYYGTSGTLNVGKANIIGNNGYGIKTGATTYLGTEDNETSEYPSVTSTEVALEITGGTTYVYDGTYISSTTDGIKTSGTLNLGINDATLNSDYPEFRGATYGLNIVSGTTNFYDGIGEGLQGGHTGIVTGTPTGLTVKTGTKEINSTTYKISYLDDYDKFVKVGDETFNSLDKAIEAVHGTGTMELIASAEVNSPSTIPDGKIITFDLAGYQLTMSQSITNNGRLTIIDSSTEHTGGISYTNKYVLVNNNILNINGGTYAGSDAAISNNGTMTLNDGTLRVINPENRHVANIENNANSTVIIEGGLIENEYTGTNNYDARGILNANNTNSKNIINGGTIKSKSRWTSYGAMYGLVEINGGYIEVESGSEYTAGVYEGNTTMSGGKIKVISTHGNAAGLSGTTTINKNSDPNKQPEIESDQTCIRGTATVNGGTFTCGNYGFNGSTYNMTDGTITANNIGVRMAHCQTCNINGGSITSNNNYGVYFYGYNYYSSLLTINSDSMPEGEKTYIKGKTNGVHVEHYGISKIESAEIIGETNYGIYTNRDIVLGVHDSEINNNNLTVTGGTHGLYLDNTIGKIYDGIFKGTTETIHGYIEEVEDNSYIKIVPKTDTEPYNIAYLDTRHNYVRNITQEKDYSDLQLAINQSNLKDKLELLEDVSIYTNISVPIDKNVSLNLDGYDLVMTKTITNEGTFKITNSSTTKRSTITSSSAVNLIVNSKDLDIEKVNITFNSNSNAVYPITNNNFGTLNIDDINITSGYYGILNNTGATLNLDNSTITSGNASIYDYGEIHLDNVTLSGTQYAVYTNATSDGYIKNSTFTNTNYSIYKYTNDSLLTVENTTISTGDLHNYSNMLITEGSINDYIYNKNNELTINGTEITNTNLSNENIKNDNGTLTLNDITLTSSFAQNNNYNGITNTGDLIIIDSEITLNRTNNYNNSGYWFTRGIYSTKGTVTSTNNSFIINDTTNGATRYNRLRGISNESTSKLISSNDKIETTKGRESTAIYNTSTNTENEINSLTSTLAETIDGYGIYIENGSIVIDGNNNIVVSATDTAYGINSLNGTFTVLSGTIEANAKTAYGAYINESTASGTFGIKDGSGLVTAEVSKTNPVIKGIGTQRGYGVKKVNGIFNYYDGKLVGTTDAKPENATDSELNFEAIFYYDHTNEYEYAQLEYMKADLIEFVAKIGDNKYTGLQVAINKASNGDTIELLKDITEEVSVPLRKRITIDLKEKTLTGKIVNDGLLTLINGTIIGNSIVTIENTGTLTLGVNDGTINNDNIIIANNDTVIDQRGLFIFYDGTLKGTTTVTGPLSAKPKNYVLYTTTDPSGEYTSITYLKPSTESEDYTKEYNYDYKGEEEVFIVPVDGYYQLEVWGAQGGSYNDEYHGGYGGYSRGEIYLQSGTILYINVGGEGKYIGPNNTIEGGYNGGGAVVKYHSDGNEKRSSGGGATHIATSSGLLSELENDRDSILIVAGGGGAAQVNSAIIGSAWGHGGSGGGFIGGSGTGINYDTQCNSVGGSQTTGGTSDCHGATGLFGKAGEADTGNASGGGGGYYGGSSSLRGASGGSGYIGNSRLTDKEMVCYDCETSDEENTKTVSVDTYKIKAVSNEPKKGNGHAKITLLEVDEVKTGKIYGFDYTGEEKVFIAPVTGTYKLETWGAQGGNFHESIWNTSNQGGYGAYSTGEIKLKAGEILYINVGGQGESASDKTSATAGGYNGGGTSGYSVNNISTGGGGGGATHIAKVSGLLETLDSYQGTWSDEKQTYISTDIIIVSGGGGGAAFRGKPGSGGGISGGDSIYNNFNFGNENINNTYSLGGTQNSGYKFGKGQNGRNGSYSYNEGVEGNGGAGGGWYGGTASQVTGTATDDSGGGGSGYIGNKSLKNKAMYCYKCPESTNTETRTIALELATDISETAEVNKVKKGDGYARITLVEIDEIKAGKEYEYDYKNEEEVFVAPVSGIYQLETWGAQGGTINGTYYGGYGGYSTGTIRLKAGDILYINVGGEGGSPTITTESPGGYNGGGNGGYYGSDTQNTITGGGGATSIATSSGQLYQLETNKDSIIIVSGGGGGAYEHYLGRDYSISGAHGGGYVGNNGQQAVYNTSYPATGGTQTTGGTAGYRGYAGSFGKGGNGITGATTGGASGGGGGYYGGGAAGHSGTGGGSGYIGNTNLSNKYMICYDCSEEENVDIKTISVTGDENVSSTPESDKAKKGSGHARITIIATNEIDIGEEYYFDYTGEQQTFTVPRNGYYKLQTWGAQGGNVGTEGIGGYGGYSEGIVYLEKNTELTIVVGGTTKNYMGGYNGGGNGNYTNDYQDYSGGGGGATHIALAPGLLKDLSEKTSKILIVAGGGGGSEEAKKAGGSGGGFIGVSGLGYNKATGGTQIRAGSSNSEYPGGFGFGGDAAMLRSTGGNRFYAGGGGGGYFGGAGGEWSTSDIDSGSGAGGSGYIGYYKMKDGIMYCYNCEESDNETTKTVSTTEYSTIAEKQKAKAENGYAVITYVSEEEADLQFIEDYSFKAEEQTFIAPTSGYYKIQAWGGQGGGSLSNGEPSYDGGTGGYSEGTIFLKENEVLYIHTGGQGELGNLSHAAAGGYNGGGYGTNDSGGTGATNEDEASGGGGGATHVAKTSGLLEELNTDRNSIIIVAGGGGGKSWSYEAGSGGGFQGGITSQTNQSLVNQETGYSFGKGQDASGKADSDGVGGGGGGWYGGYMNDVRAKSSGSGGSGYIGNKLLKNKVMYCYNCEESDETNTKTISVSEKSAIPTANTPKEGNGHVRITLMNVQEITEGQSFDYESDDSEEIFIVPVSGYYQLEAWGAQGGDNNTSSGTGGYSRGQIYLEKNQILYINVGSQGGKTLIGESMYVEGGYNGGGYTNGQNCCSRTFGSGGGATSIATSSGLLSELEENKDSIIIVAGGGGGGFNGYGGGSGGGFEGMAGIKRNYYGPGTGGTQTSGGINPSAEMANGSFGQGGEGGEEGRSTGGGGGYYGGSGSWHIDGAGGGSGYIGNANLFNAEMYCFNCTTSADETTKTISVDYAFDIPTPNHAKTGDGYAIITYLGNEESLIQKEYNYKFNTEKQYYEFKALKTGTYKFELWGAQGGTVKGVKGGLGGYTSGTIELLKNQKLYIYVGGAGQVGTGGYNGGGTGYCGEGCAAGGGGATDVRTEKGQWDDISSLKSRIMVAGGGGGGYNYRNQWKTEGAAAGGLEGYYATPKNTCISYGGTQTEGGTCSYSEEISGSFGKGGNGTNVASGGGSGYYGGAGRYDYSGSSSAGGGGSSFISGHDGCISIIDTIDNSIIHSTDSHHYSELIFGNTKMIDGNGFEWKTDKIEPSIGMPSHEDNTTMTGNEGNGFARVTFLG